MLVIRCGLGVVIVDGGELGSLVGCVMLLCVSCELCL